MNIKELKDGYDISKRILKLLKSKNALPVWWDEISDSGGKDWLMEFHKNFISQDFPAYLKLNFAGTINTSLRKHPTNTLIAI